MTGFRFPLWFQNPLQPMIGRIHAIIISIENSPISFNQSRHILSGARGGNKRKMKPPPSNYIINKNLMHDFSRAIPSKQIIHLGSELPKIAPFEKNGRHLMITTPPKGYGYPPGNYCKWRVHRISCSPQDNNDDSITKKEIVQNTLFKKLTFIPFQPAQTWVHDFPVFPVWWEMDSFPSLEL